MTKVYCKDCSYFRAAPYEAAHTGCWHPDNMKSKQKDAYLDQQQLPGNHRQINVRNDCAQYEAKPVKLSIWKRIAAGLAG